jgi:hypothetical protein
VYLGPTESAAPRNNERSWCYIWPQEWQPGRSEKPVVLGLVLIKATGIRSRPLDFARPSPRVYLTSQHPIDMMHRYRLREFPDNPVTRGPAAGGTALCPCCGGRMIIVESFGRGGEPRAPPSPQAGSGTAIS